MVQQLASEGNILTLFLKASPMGLMASTMCSCSLTRSTKKLNRDRGVPSVCLDFSRCLVGGRRRAGKAASVRFFKHYLLWM